MVDGSDGQQSIQELKQRYEQLNKRKIEADANLKHAEERLAELQQEAREKYDTDELEELQAKLAAMEEENERKRAEYQQSLDRIEHDLQEVEKKYATVNQGEENA